MDETRLLSFLHWLTPRILALDPEPDRRWGELSVALLDDAGIAVPHQRHLGVEGPTDVISFGYPPMPPERFHTGEILANVQRACEEGPGRGGIGHELAFYLAHGFHHLIGADDATEEQRAEMHRIELAWLDDADKAGVLGDLMLG